MTTAIEKKVRLSKDRETEYQIEFYKVNSTGLLYEYRVRRGLCGTWTRWFRTRDMRQILVNLGFNRKRPTLLNEFYFESYFGRGRIPFNDKVVKLMVGTTRLHPLNAHVYSRLKQISHNKWILPSSALENKRIFNHVRQLIRENNS